MGIAECGRACRLLGRANRYDPAWLFAETASARSLARGAAHRAGDAHADAQRVTREVGERHVFDVDGLQARALGAGGDGALDRLGCGGGDRVLAGHLAIDLVGLAADLRDRSTN